MALSKAPTFNENLARLVGVHYDVKEFCTSAGCQSEGVLIGIALHFHQHGNPSFDRFVQAVTWHGVVLGEVENRALSLLCCTFKCALLLSEVVRCLFQSLEQRFERLELGCKFVSPLFRVHQLGLQALCTHFTVTDTLTQVGDLCHHTFARLGVPLDRFSAFHLLSGKVALLLF